MTQLRPFADVQRGAVAQMQRVGICDLGLRRAVKVIRAITLLSPDVLALV